MSFAECRHLELLVTIVIDMRDRLDVRCEVAEAWSEVLGF